MKRKLLIIIMAFILIAGCSKWKPFGDNYKFNYISKDEAVEIPIYIYAEYTNGDLVSEDIFDFVPSNQNVKIEDINEYKYDENNKIISFKINNSSMIECYHNERITEVIQYNFQYIQPTMFDYNTGDVYRINKENIASIDAFKDAIDLSSDDFKYTDITWKKNNYKIGIYEQNLVQTKESENEVDVVDGKDHFKNPVYSYIKVFVLVPNDYDGVSIALDKNGSTKEKVLKQREYEIKYFTLKEEAKNGTKSSELEEMEKEENQVYKLIDKKNNKRKEYSEDSFYVMRLSK